eukprot:1161424-Lingulodinium_polyedra.AAC.1
MGNAAFRTALAIKLDLIRVPVGVHCKLKQAAQGRQCGCPMDRRGHHADVCNSAGRQRTHTA